MTTIYGQLIKWQIYIPLEVYKLPSTYKLHMRKFFKFRIYTYAYKVSQTILKQFDYITWKIGRFLKCIYTV